MAVFGRSKSVSVISSDSDGSGGTSNKNGKTTLRGNLLATSVFTIVVFCLVNIPGCKAKPIPGSDFSFPDTFRNWNLNSPSSFSNTQFSDPYKNLNFNTHPGSSYFNTDGFKYGDIDDDEMESSIKSIAIGVGIFILVAFIITCVVCFCCPICIIAKMRQRRRGQVYRNAIVVNNVRNGANARNNTGQPQVTTALHVQNAVSPNQNGVNCIAISNNANTRNSPYPVQESVTVVPVITPQPQPVQPFYGPGQNYMNNSYQNQSINQPQLPSYQPTPNMPNMPNDLPPPYPGLPREMDNANLPFNPYFSGDAPSAPSAPFQTPTKH